MERSLTMAKDIIEEGSAIPVHFWPFSKLPFL
jgi:hypothetical protein